MKGSNTLKLNTATMLQAMQLWLNDQFKTPPKAVGITCEDRVGGMFILSVSEPADTNSRPNPGAE